MNTCSSHAWVCDLPCLDRSQELIILGQPYEVVKVNGVLILHTGGGAEMGRKRGNKPKLHNRQTAEGNKIQDILLSHPSHVC